QQSACDKTAIWRIVSESLLVVPQIQRTYSMFNFLLRPRASSGLECLHCGQLHTFWSADGTLFEGPLHAQCPFTGQPFDQVWTPHLPESTEPLSGDIIVTAGSFYESVIRT